MNQVRPRESLRSNWLFAVLTAALAFVLWAPKGAMAISNPVRGTTENADWQGDRVFLGSYEQDNDESNGPEPILWRVLQVDQNRMLLLSEYVLDVKPFHSRSETITWDHSDIRNWLNSDFLNTAFAKRGSWTPSNVLETLCKNAPNPYYGTAGGKNTTDRVFLLSWEDTYNEDYGFPGAQTAERKSTGEMIPYAEVSAARICYPTLYAVAHDVLITRQHSKRDNPQSGTVDGFGSAYWILRTPGASQRFISYVSRWGRTTINGRDPVDHSESGIRPCVWIDTSRLNFVPVREGYYCAEDDSAYLDECTHIPDYKEEILNGLLNEPIRETPELRATEKDTVDELENPVYGGTEDGDWDGDRVFFGTYKRQPVLWRLLHTDSDSLTLMTEYALVKSSYAYDNNNGITWNTSKVRAFLNQELFFQLFSGQEQTAVRTVHLENKRNPRYGTYGGTDTEDRIYLLDYDECMSAEYGFAGEGIGKAVQSYGRICYPINHVPQTESAVFGKTDEKGNQIWNGKKTAKWLLRTPGYMPIKTSEVNQYGDVYHHEAAKMDDELWLRPVVVLDKTKVQMMRNDERFPTLIVSE